MIPPLFMDIHPDHLVLDMCAAPGSKSSQILDFLACSKMEKHSNNSERDCPFLNSGGLIANDIDVKRAFMVTRQISVFGHPFASVTCFDAAMFPSLVLKESDEDDVDFGERAVCKDNVKRRKRILQFDRVLADVPCSGDGTLRKNPDIWRSWSVTGKEKTRRKGPDFVAVAVVVIAIVFFVVVFVVIVFVVVCCFCHTFQCRSSCCSYRGSYCCRFNACRKAFFLALRALI